MKEDDFEPMDDSELDDLESNPYPYPLDEDEKQLMELMNGRPPENEEEEEIVKELKQMEKDGIVPYIPSN